MQTIFLLYHRHLISNFDRSHPNNAWYKRNSRREISSMANPSRHNTFSSILRRCLVVGTLEEKYTFLKYEFYKKQNMFISENKCSGETINFKFKTNRRRRRRIALVIVAFSKALVAFLLSLKEMGLHRLFSVYFHIFIFSVSVCTE